MEPGRDGTQYAERCTHERTVQNSVYGTCDVMELSMLNGSVDPSKVPKSQNSVWINLVKIQLILSLLRLASKKGQNCLAHVRHRRFQYK